MALDPSDRARVAFAEAARELADFARRLVGDIAAPAAPGDRIRDARTMRRLALVMVDYAVLIDLSEGASWEQIGAAAGTNPVTARSRYEDLLEQWMSGVRPDGTAADTKPEETAHTLDAWYQRHADAWDLDLTNNPVTRALHP